MKYEWRVKMHEKIYKAFHQDISLDNYNELDELKEKFESMKPSKLSL